MAVSYKVVSDNIRNEALLGAKITRRKDSNLAEVNETVGQPHEIFTLDPGDLTEEPTLQNAKYAGWHFFVSPSDNTAINGESVVEVVAGNDGPRFTHRQRGRIASATRRLLAALEQDPITSQRDFTVSLLRIPALARTDALWLQSEDASQDMVVPIISASRDLVPARKYTVAEFVAALNAIKMKIQIDGEAVG